MHLLLLPHECVTPVCVAPSDGHVVIDVKNVVYNEPLRIVVVYG